MRSRITNAGPEEHCIVAIDDLAPACAPAPDSPKLGRRRTPAVVPAVVISRGGARVSRGLGLLALVLVCFRLIRSFAPPLAVGWPLASSLPPASAAYPRAHIADADDARPPLSPPARLLPGVDGRLSPDYPGMDAETARAAVPPWFSRVLKPPSLSDCPPHTSRDFVVVTVYADTERSEGNYGAALERLLTSCEAHAICCLPMHLDWAELEKVATEHFLDEVPEEVLRQHGVWYNSGKGGRGSLSRKGEAPQRARFLAIALKPIAMLVAMHALALPMAYVDVDMTFLQFPALFARDGVADEGRAGADVRVFNWQGSANVRLPNGRPRLKAASGVVFLNATAGARDVARAWARAQSTGYNMLAPDDQMLDLVWAEAGFSERPDVAFDWLPPTYLPVMQRTRVVRGVTVDVFDPDEVVIQHDAGRRPGGHGGNSYLKPMMPDALKVAITRAPRAATEQSVLVERLQREGVVPASAQQQQQQLRAALADDSLGLGAAGPLGAAAGGPRQLLTVEAAAFAARAAEAAGARGAARSHFVQQPQPPRWEPSARITTSHHNPAIARAMSAPVPMHHVANTRKQQLLQQQQMQMQQQLQVQQQLVQQQRAAAASAAARTAGYVDAAPQAGRAAPSVPNVPAGPTGRDRDTGR